MIDVDHDKINDQLSTNSSDSVDNVLVKTIACMWGTTDHESETEESDIN